MSLERFRSDASMVAVGLSDNVPDCCCFPARQFFVLEPVSARRAKHELALAGYEKVSFPRKPKIAEIWRCRDHYELKMGVDAFILKSGSQSGLYCIPQGNRPTKLLLD